MKRNLFFFSLVINTLLFAQNYKPCGASIMRKKVLIEEPQLIEKRKNYLRSLDSLNNSNFKINNEIRTIPVVVHVMHTGGSSNISDAQIYDAMRIINEDFNKLNADTSVVADAFQNNIANIGVEFKLALKDPNGNCTKGITRTFTELTNDAGENVKELIKWDPSKYLNIWVVSNISIGAGGYSYYPLEAPNNDANAGVVILATQFGSIGESSASNSSRRSLTHEIGHYLNLAHTWGDTNNTNEPQNCYDDDGINDTPETIGSDATCNLSQTSCGSLDNVQNFMDYSSCPIMYTNGQKNAMRAALSYGQPWHNAPRNNLWTESNLTETGLLNNEEEDCIAIVEFISTSDISCSDQEVEWQNISYNYDSALNFEWYFEGAIPSSSNEEHPIVIYEEPGTYSTTLTVTTSAGEQTKSIENAIHIFDSENKIIAPSTYIFSSQNAFPIDAENNFNWYNSNWNWSNESSTSEAGSIRIRSTDLNENEISKLYSPLFDLSNVSSPCFMYYDYAYAKKSTNTSDELKLKVSDDCGTSWMTRISKDTEELMTTTGNHFFTYTPDDDEWETQKVNLNPWAGREQLQFVYEFSGYEGNYLYIDNIRFGVPNLSVNELIAKTLDLNVAPNPNNGNAFITFNMLQPQTIDFHLVDLLGNTIISYQDEFKTGQYKINLANLNSEIKPGLYFLKCTVGDYSETQQVIVY